MKICMVAPALPPKIDGIGHYTARLAASLATAHQVTVLIGWDGSTDLIPGVRAEEAFSPAQPRSIRRIVRCVETQRPDWIVIQYNPFSYGRWGLNLHLPAAVRAIRHRCPETRVALMVHEPFVPRSTWKFTVMALWQRHQFRQLGCCADVVFTSIEPWAHKFRPWFPGKPMVHLPVGSNIAVYPIQREEARARLGLAQDVIVLGMFGTVHSARLLSQARDAAAAVRAAGYEAVFLYIGPHSAQLRAALGVDLPMIADGPLPAEEVSRRFSAIDIYMAPFLDGISTRRSSMMVALQHGTPIVGTRGALTDKILSDLDNEGLLLSDVSDASGYTERVLRLVRDPALRNRIGCRAKQLYDEEFAWERITAKMLRSMV